MGNNNKEKDSTQYLPIGMCLGMSIGMAIGAAFGNTSIGMCMGLGLGVFGGAMIDMMNKKKTDENSGADE